MNYTDFCKWLAELDLSTITANPTTFKLNDFEQDIDFTKSMFLAGERFLSEEDVVVRYSKPYTEDRTDVIVQFQVLRSKAKMFFNFFKNNKGMKIGCFLSSNKEFKEFVKFFNSLGVKDEDGNNISSKEIDYTSIFKECVEETKKTIGNTDEVYVFVELYVKKDDEDNEYISMSYAPIIKENMQKRMNQYSNHCGLFTEIKDYIKREILKVQE